MRSLETDEKEHGNHGRILPKHPVIESQVQAATRQLEGPRAGVQGHHQTGERSVATRVLFDTRHSQRGRQNHGGKMSKPLTTTEMVIKCFNPTLTPNGTEVHHTSFSYLASAARKFVRLEERQKKERDWDKFRKECRKTTGKGI
jgi:hypothetical protein